MNQVKLNDFGQAPTSCTTHVDLDGTTASLACAANASPAALLGDTGSCAEHMEIMIDARNVCETGTYLDGGGLVAAAKDLICFFLIVKYPEISQRLYLHTMLRIIVKH